jgi:hypothetical protein
MDNQQKNQSSNEQQSDNQQNPTLHDKGTRVPDYGNVMGGSSDTNVEQGKHQSNEERSGSESKETMGNP